MEQILEKLLILIATVVVAYRPQVEALLERIYSQAPAMKQWTHGDALLVKGAARAKAKFRELAIKFRWPGFTVNLITIGKGGKLDISTVTIDGTPLNAMIKLVADAKALDGSTCRLFTEDVVKIGLDAGLKNAWKYVRDGFVITNDDGIKNVYRIHKRQVFDANGRKLEPDEKKVALAHPYRTYNCLVSQSNTTAGERKKWQFTCLADQLDIPLIKLTLTFGMSLLLIAKNAKGAIAKASTRLSQYMTPQANGGRIYCYALFLGKDIFADGQGYLTAQAVVRMLVTLSGGRYTTLAKWVVGLSLQGRPAAAKSMNLVVYRGYLLRLIRRKIKESGEPPIVLVRSETGVQDLVRVAEAYLGFGPWKGRVVIVAETREMADNWEKHVELYLDMNANKAPVDLGLPMYFSILEVTHAAHDPEHGAKLSVQVLQKMAFADFGAMKKLVALVARRAVLETKSGWMKAVDGSVSLEIMKDSRTVLEKIMPSCRKVLRPIFDSRIDTELDAFTSSLGTNRGKITLAVPGEYRKSISDPAVEILGMDYKVLRVYKGTAEILAPGFAEGTEFFVARFPSTGHREYLRCRVISPETYESRLHEMHVDPYAVRDIMDVVNALSEGIIALPASKYVLSALGGADFDGDGFCLYQVAQTSEHFRKLNIEAVEYITDLEMLDELIREGMRYFFEVIEPLCGDVPEF